MRIAILSGGNGWHVRDLLRAARDQRHVVEVLDFRTLHGRLAAGPGPLDSFEYFWTAVAEAGATEEAAS